MLDVIELSTQAPIMSPCGGTCEHYRGVR